MRDLWRWLPRTTQAWLITVLLTLLSAAILGGYLLSSTAQRERHGAALAATPTPTLAPGFRLLWTGEGIDSGTTSPPLTITDDEAARGLTLLWRCLPASNGLPTTFGVNIEQNGHAFAWVGVSAQCGGSGQSFINTLHGGTFRLHITATGPWTVRLLARLA